MESAATPNVFASAARAAGRVARLDVRLAEREVQLEVVRRRGARALEPGDRVGEPAFEKQREPQHLLRLAPLDRAFGQPRSHALEHVDRLAPAVGVIQRHAGQELNARVGLVERRQPIDGFSRSAAIDERARAGQRGRERVGLPRRILGRTSLRGLSASAVRGG